MPDKAEISRQNGSKSRGPVTARGKRRSSRNATRHGLLGQDVVLRNESTRRYNRFARSLVARLQPSDDVELSVVEEVAASFWRLRRSWAIETATIDLAMKEDDTCTEPERIAKAFGALADNGKAIHLVQRYETWLQRSYDRALRNLRHLQQMNNYQTNPAENHS